MILGDSLKRFALILIVALAPTIAWSDEATAPDRSPAEEIPHPEEVALVPGLAFGLSARIEASSRASYAADDAEVGIGRIAATLSVRAPLATRTIVGVEVAQEVDLFDFRNGDGRFEGVAAPDGPFGTVSMTSFRAIAVHPLGGDWSLFVLGTVDFASEDASDWGGGVTGGGAVAARYQWTPSFALTLGVLARTRIEDDPFVLPFPGIEWHITDRLTLATAQTISLAYVLGDERAWRFDVALGFEVRRFRLVDDGPFPSGVGEETRVPLSVGVAYRPWGLTARIGAATNSKLQVFDSNGRRIGEEHPANVALLSLGLDLSF